MRLNCENGFGKPKNPYYLFEETEEENLHEAVSNHRYREWEAAHPSLPVYTSDGQRYMEKVEVEGELVWQKRDRDTMQQFRDCEPDERVKYPWCEYQQIYRVLQPEKADKPVEGEENKGMTAKELIQRERQRQIDQEGWSKEHDDKHTKCELKAAGDCYYEYAMNNDYEDKVIPRWWPWQKKWWKPKNQVQDFMKAGALYIAEMERLERSGGLVGQQLTSLRIGKTMCENAIDALFRAEGSKNFRQPQKVEQPHYTESEVREIATEFNKHYCTIPLENGFDKWWSASTLNKGNR